MLDFGGVILFRMEIDQLAAAVVVDGEFAEVRGPAAEGGSGAETEFGLVGSGVNGRGDTVVKAAHDHRPVRVPIDEADRHLGADPRDELRAPPVAGPRLNDARPNRVAARRVPTVIPVEPHFHPAELVGVDLLTALHLDVGGGGALRAHYQGSVDAIQPRPTGDRRLPPGHAVQEAGEVAGIGGGGALVDPGLVAGVMAGAPHGISIVVRTGRPAGDDERAAGHHPAEMAGAFEQRSRGFRGLHFPGGAIANGAVVERQRRPPEGVARGRAAGRKRRRLVAGQLGRRIFRVVVPQRPFAENRARVLMELVDTRAGLGRRSSDTECRVRDRREGRVVLRDHQRMGARGMPEEVEPAFLLHQPRGEMQVRLVKLHRVLARCGARRAGQIGQLHIAEHRIEDVGGRFGFVDPAVHRLAHEPQLGHEHDVVDRVGVGPRLAANRTAG